MGENRIQKAKMQKIWRNYIDMPPVWLLFYMGLAWGQSVLWNPFSYASPVATMIGRTLILAGLVLMSLAAFLFWHHRTTVVPKRIPDSIITVGPYRYSRNPIYVADALVLTGFAISLGSVLALFLVPLFMWTIRKRFIEGEEARIRAEFGQAYEAYCARTRRWL